MGLEYRMNLIQQDTLERSRNSYLLSMCVQFHPTLTNVFLTFISGSQWSIMVVLAMAVLMDTIIMSLAR